jgi:hypothetical protein
LRISKFSRPHEFWTTSYGYAAGLVSWTMIDAGGAELHAHLVL